MTHQDERPTDQPAASNATANPSDPAGPAPDGQPRKRRRRRRRGRKPDGQGGPAPDATSPSVAIDDIGDDGPDDIDMDDAPDGDDAPVRTTPAPAAPAPARADHAPPKKVQDIFDEVTSFADLGLRNSVLKGVEACGFKRPTKVQAQIIPVVLQGRDVLGQAKTGSGKTAAFGLPLFNLATRGLPFQSVILVPTRELAQQVAGELAELGQFTPIKTSAVFGGESIQTQSRNLEQGPEIIVATPGRLMDMLERGRLHLNNVKFVVLDEVDRMLDIGFRDDIRKILSGVRHDHRTIFVSATISDEIETLARKHMRDPVKLVTTAGSLTVSLVEQHYLAVAPWDKRRLLTHLLTHEEPALTVVFCRTKRTVDNVAEHLHKHNIDVQAIHGDMQQGRRNRVMSQLRGGKLAVLIASDLAARGLDVEDISHVINYDLPEDPEVYIHRIGRTARAGRHGVAWSLVTPDQGDLLTAIEKLANIEIPKMDYPDFQASPQPEGFGDRGRGGPGRGFGGGGRGGPPRGGPRRDDRAPRPEPAQSSAPRADGGGHGGGSAGGHGGSGYGAPPSPAPRAPGPAPATAQSSGRPLPTKDNPVRFPGGLKPTKMPPRVMGGKVKTSRSGRGQTPD